MSQTIRGALTDAWEKCEEAVCHVGMANYQHREDEAQSMVRVAFDVLERDLRRIRRAATKRRLRRVR